MDPLKIDDIPGARPRIRHAPRNLIRQQKISQQQHMSYEHNPYTYKNEPRRRANYFNSETDPYKQPSNRQYRVEGPEPTLMNQVSLSESYHQPSPPLKTPSTAQQHPSQHILTKDAPVVNYDAYGRSKAQSTYARTYNYDLYAKFMEQLGREQPGRKQAEQSQIRTSRRESPRQELELGERTLDQRNVVNAQAGRQQAGEKETRSIFRGLGYNIITNSKFEYGMENGIKNSTSRWLQ